MSFLNSDLLRVAGHRQAYRWVPIGSAHRLRTTTTPRRLGAHGYRLERQLATLLVRHELLRPKTGIGVRNLRRYDVLITIF